MRINGMRAQIGYNRRWISSGQPARVAPNRLNQEFSVEAPNQRWVGDITDIRTDERFLYLAVVLDLFSRRVVGWSMQPPMSRDLVMQALLSALWRRRPTGTVLVHSDQGNQYGSQDYRAFLAEHNLEPSMSRRGNCLDNAVAESFFSTVEEASDSSAACPRGSLRPTISRGSRVSRKPWAVQEPASTRPKSNVYEQCLSGQERKLPTRYVS